MDPKELAQQVIDGNRRALARAITLVESARADHREQAIILMDALKASNRVALRVGLSGTPGVGKSTFIETFGMMLIREGLKVAVLAVDPSSSRSGGSILGDKTRMELLSREPHAFIRPSPSQLELGGVARRTREAVSLCEAAGYDIILIETVGVGQSETVVSQMSDLFLLLLAPAGGDELQGVKRGIMEIADMILVNKADGDLKAAANRTCADYAGALRLIRKRSYDPEGYPKAMTVSALQDNGLTEAWTDMQTLIDWRRAHGHFDARRARQAEYWFAQEIRFGLLGQLDREPLKSMIAQLAGQVASGDITPSHAAHDVLTALREG
ncbi:methylmalonyl Co-A mutase-associated GTPase MeaB [Celeribacter marinus]|uniref:Putative periplasmic protein kinase ArgK and related GTPase of G3E family n=1 Tax=Celeribacter marinus TaxID=1397108 RepID=A0A0N9ZGT0_9RHOB|nr:methylmalonyl Co-A mutase-associated GTPase MeaB [Celeribacter marinus]ALI55007.1 putative periplasmic protein kinase ArgK and related GTPase of G3E family [Celeribacter marinus]SFK04566.1 LAO/AO transport system kinase [Celeribacter marinus]